MITLQRPQKAVWPVAAAALLVGSILSSCATPPATLPPAATQAPATHTAPPATPTSTTKATAIPTPAPTATPSPEPPSATPAAPTVTATAAPAVTRPADPPLPAGRPTDTPRPSPTATPTATGVAATATPYPFPPRIALEPILAGLQAPLYLTHAQIDAQGNSALFVVEKGGRVFIKERNVDQTSVFLDITARVGSQASEQGLLSIAFPPDYAATGSFYVNYTNRAGRSVVSRFKAQSGNLRQANPATEQILLSVEQPAANHNGGLLKFGPDGYLYIGLGDGGQAGDPWGNAQNPAVLLGKLLRVDVAGSGALSIPLTNPFQRQEPVRPEIWALGLRNPWRFSFDRLTGELYIADVGQGRWEEIHLQPAASRGGENYGWDIMEGSHCFEPREGCDTSGLALPIAEYDHTQGCSITGGYVYRGARYPQLQGIYLFGDFCSGRVWGLQRQPSGDWRTAELL
ncbi:MAG: hypothetical protein GX605_02770, partial [Chloroflexi bacterium]|nr:hypothetical protein [Chloroflexota bacterium]